MKEDYPDTVQREPPATGWFRKGLAVAVLFSACAVGYWVATSTGRDNSSTGVLSVPRESLDFGEAWEDPQFAWRLPITNSSANDVAIHGFQSSSCGCVVVDPRSLVIRAGETATVRVTLDLTRTATSPAQGDAVRSFEAHILPEVEGIVAKHAPWKVHGRVRIPFILSARSVDFGDSLMQGRMFVSKSIQLKPLIPLANVSADCDPALATVATTETSGEYSVVITPSESLRPGRFEFPVKVQAATPDGATVAARLSVSGTVLGHFHFVPEILVVGAKQLGDAVEETVVLQSRTGTGFQVIRVHEPSEHVKVESLGKDENSVQQFRVSVVVSEPGNYSGTIRVQVRRESRSDSEEIVLPLSYFGKAKH